MVMYKNIVYGIGFSLHVRKTPVFRHTAPMIIIFVCTTASILYRYKVYTPPEREYLFSQGIKDIRKGKSCHEPHDHGS
jgi:hypothetical protein